MPSSRPRISVVLSDEQHRLLKRLRALTGRSQAALVVECLEALEPALSAQLVLLEAASEIAQGADRQQAIAAIENVVHGLDLASILALDQLDDVRAKVEAGMADLKAAKFTPGNRGVGGVAGGVSASPKG